MLQKISMNVIDEKLDQIFKGKTWDEQGNTFEKRKIIYDYLVDNLNYDFQALENILNKGKRNYYKDITDVLYHSKGVCHSISYVYKLLLSRIGVYTLLIAANEIVEDDDLEIINITSEKKLGHMFTLIKNIDNTFSFDDLTNAIVYKNEEKKSIYFNYDLDKVYEYKQEILGGFPSTFLDVMVLDRIQDEENEKLYERNTNRRGLSNIPVEKIKTYI